MAEYDSYLVGGAALRRILEKLKDVFGGFIGMASESDVRNIVKDYGHDDD